MPNTTITADQNPAPQTRYATAEEVMATRSPEPLSEEYVDPETGLMYKIEGFKKFHEKSLAFRSAFEISERVKNMELTIRDSSGEAFIPSEEEIEAAVLASKCVREPKMGELQWLATLDRSDLLYRLYLRIAHCNGDDTD